MTFTELVEQVSKESGISKDEVSLVLKSAVNEIHTTVMKGESVALPGLGKFIRKVSKPRMAFGKMTSEKSTVKFSPYDSVAVKK